MSHRIADLDLAGREWCLIIDGDRVVNAAAVRDLLANEASMRIGEAVWCEHTVVRAPADMPVTDFVASGAMKGAGAGPFVVLVATLRDGDLVWAGDDLMDVLLYDVLRTGGDVMLPAPVHIPEIIRQCAYRDESGLRCGAVRRLVTRPYDRLQCDVDGGDVHDFHWVENA